jgi:predicted amidophosphoribosyltransferase
MKYDKVPGRPRQPVHVHVRDMTIYAGKGPKDRLACPECGEHWPDNVNACPECKSVNE